MESYTPDVSTSVGGGDFTDRVTSVASLDPSTLDLEAFPLRACVGAGEGFLEPRGFFGFDGGGGTPNLIITSALHRCIFC